MKVRLGFLTKHDNEPDVDFPHEYSSYDAGVSNPLRKQKGPLTLDEYPRTTKSRTVTSEGLQGATRGKYLRTPPQYPPMRGELKDCEGEVVAEVDTDPQYVVLSVDDLGDGVPAGYEDMGWDEAMTTEKKSEIKTGIVAVTPGAVKANVNAWANDWGAENPEGTPSEFIRDLRNFTS